MQVENKNSNVVENVEGNKPSYGYYQWCNFGKHKGKSYYDIANTGDFKYLSWLARSDKLNETCLEHVMCALKSESSQGKWEKQQKIDDDNKDNDILIYYSDGTNNGPFIICHKCLICQRNKNKKCFSKNMEICDTCIKVRSQLNNNNNNNPNGNSYNRQPQFNNNNNNKKYYNYN